MALVEPRASFFSEQTQDQTNRLPQYHIGRRKRDSNWSRLTNELDGVTLHDYLVQDARAFRNMFLRTVHLDEPDLLGVVRLPQGVNLEPRQNNLNILRNSSFEIRSRPDKVGDFWEHSGTVAVQTPSLFGARAPALTPAAAETSRIQQTVTRDPWNLGDDRAFSAWYRIPSWAGGTIPAASHGLIVTVTYGDGSTQDFRAAFASDTGGNWRRIMLTVSPTKTVFSYVVKLETTRSATFDIDVPVSVDAVQVQNGTTATVWEPNLFDGPHWFESPALSPINFDTEVPVFVTDSIRDFFFEAVPLRAELFNIRSVTSTADRRGGFGEAIDFHKMRWPFTWDIDTAANKVRRIGIDPADIYGLFDLSFFTGTSEGNRFEEDVAGLTYLAVADLGRWIGVVHEMTGLNGQTIVALSVVDPLVPHPAPSHYESKYTIELPLTPGFDYHRAELRLEDVQHLYVATASREYVLRLFHDYAIIDALGLQVFFRERYDSVALVR